VIEGLPTLDSFKDYYLGTILHPRRTFDALMNDDRRLKFAFWAVSINAVLYTLVYIFLTIGNGAPSSFKPWLAIPSNVYYHYDRFLLAPSMFADWILVAGIAHLLSRLFQGKGSFEDTLSAFGFGITIASLASLLHDLPDAFLGAIGFLDLREYEVILNSPTIWRVILLTLYSLSIVWYLVLFPKGIGAAQRIGRGPAIFIGVFTFLVYLFFFLTFNR
jgi:hypothetical protein